MRKMSMMLVMAMVVGVLILGQPVFADFSVNVDKKTVFVVDVRDGGPGCLVVVVVFTTKPNLKIAEKILFEAMKQAKLLESSHEILGIASYYKDANEINEVPLKFNNNKFFIIKKGTSQIVPSKY